MRRIFSSVVLLIMLAEPAWSRPPIVDVHVHTEPSRYGLISDIFASTGVTRFINLSGGSPGSGLEEALAAADPFDDRILVCVNLRWREFRRPDFVERQVQNLSEAARLGARCLKISKALGLAVPNPDDPEKLMAVDDPRLDPIWAAAGQLGLPVFIHTSDPKVFFEPMGPDNERMAELSVHPGWSFADPMYPRRNELLAARDRVLARHRGTIFIGVHLANNPEDLDYVTRVLAENPNLYVDIAARLPEIGRHNPQKVRALFTKFQDRILFGTDLGLHDGLMLGSVGKKKPGLPDLFLFYADHFRWLETADSDIPHPTPIQGDWTIDGIKLPADILTKIYAGNALRLFWNLPAPTELDAQVLEQAPGMVTYF